MKVMRLLIPTTLKNSQRKEVDFAEIRGASCLLTKILN